MRYEEKCVERNSYALWIAYECQYSRDVLKDSRGKDSRNERVTNLQWNEEKNEKKWASQFILLFLNCNSTTAF